MRPPVPTARTISPFHLRRQDHAVRGDDDATAAVSAGPEPIVGQASAEGVSCNAC